MRKGYYNYQSNCRVIEISATCHCQIMANLSLPYCENLPFFSRLHD